MLKTNVVKKDYILLIRDEFGKEKKFITVNAESLDSAKLKIPEGWEFVVLDRVRHAR